MLFGSRATGTNTVSSDVDIALFGDRLTLTDQARLAAALDEIPMAQSVDLLLYGSIRNGSLQEHIRNQGVEWFARPMRRCSDRAAAPSPDARDSALSQEWSTMPFTDAFLINPTVPIERGSPTPFVDMAAIDPGRRAVHSMEVREFRGSGSRFQHGDTLMARITPCLENGKIARYYASSDLNTGHGSTEFIVVRGRSEVTDSRYAFYVARSDLVRGYAIGQMTGTSGRQRVPAESLAHLDVAVPPLSEQRAIAHILGTLDDKIELNRRMNATLEAMARALFRSWFVDFDPVRAKMEGRDTGLPKDIADLFPDRLVDSELGEMPEDWDIGHLSEHFQAVKGVSYKGSGLGRGGMPRHNLNSVHEGGGYKHEGIKFYSEKYADRHVVRPGDVIVANTEQGHDRLLIGYAAIVPRLFGDRGIASHHVYRLRARSNGRLSAPFLHLLLNSPWMHDLVSRYANGTTVNMLPIDAVQKPMVLVPPRALIEAFDALALRLEHRRERAVQESGTLGVLRDALLPKLVSGELRVNGRGRTHRADERSIATAGASA